ncbi:MAG: carboxypeptidase regulatory-like domain-containing protein, partial [Vicinamibacteria bacterium]|nr:carboxypeptidase regulatory-like domain-containing protein [Vicinamibacteria bacterium]
MKKIFTLGLAILLMASVGAFAQTASGNVYGKVVDQSGAVLPGASVTISGEAGSRSSVTGADGTFRFLNLDPNDYTVTVNLSGFGSANRRITVQTGLSATLDIAMKVGGQSETVEVTAESALVDVKKRGTSANLTSQDLIDVPNSRDPWGIMNQVAGALVDRVNIAGNENGQQASVAGKGSYAGDRVWSLDGLVITDMAATGASPTYFDFDAFQEINVSTGGGDLTMQTGGFGLNMVTKRGTNTFHGGGRYLVTDSKWQSSNLPDSLKTDARLRGGAGHCQAEGGATAFREVGDSIDSIKDYGFDLGGPIIKDKLWFYGTYGKQDIKNCRFAGTFDDTLLPSYNFKINWQAAPSTMVTAFYFLGSKQKFGRGVGFPVTETDDFLWD